MFVLAVIVVPSTSRSQDNPAERPIALVIGNANYGGTNASSGAPIAPPSDGRYMSDIPAAISDAVHMRDLLEEAKYDVTFRTDLDGASLHKALADFSRRVSSARSGTKAVVYYSGHSTQIEAKIFLIPVGAVITSATDIFYGDVDQATHGLVPITDLDLARPDSSQSDFSLVILDSCRENPWPSLGVRGVRSDMVGDSFSGASPSQSYLSIVGDGFPTRPKSTIMALAAAPGAFAKATDSESLFTAALLKNLRPYDESVLGALRRAAREVVDETDSSQIPHIYSPPFLYQCLAECSDTTRESDKSIDVTGLSANIRSVIESAQAAAFSGWKQSLAAVIVAAKAHPDGKIANESSNSYAELGSSVKQGVGRFVDYFFEAKDDEYLGEISASRPEGVGVYNWVCAPVFLRNRCPISRYYTYEGAVRQGKPNGLGRFSSNLDGTQLLGEFLPRIYDEDDYNDEERTPFIRLGISIEPDGTTKEGLFAQNQLVEGIIWKRYDPYYEVINLAAPD